MSFQVLSGKSLTFVTTDDCTAFCDHCIMCCRPGAKHYLTSEQMCKAVDDALTIGPLTVVVFTGGEPTLLKTDLLKAIRHCHDRGIVTRVVTNAHWAYSEARAKQILQALRDAGLDELNFSLDDYHAPYIPEQYVKNAWKAAKGMGFLSMVIANSQGKNAVIDGKYIQNLLEEEVQIRDADHRHGPITEKRDPDGTLYMISEGRLQRSGRAAEELDDADFFDPLDDNALVGGCNTVCSQPTISFDNHVWPCCGLDGLENYVLDLGNLNKESLDTILNRAKDSVLLNAIYYIGPLLLRNYIRKKDPTITFRDNYTKICEICEDITANPEAVKVLRQNYYELTALILKIQEKRKEQQHEPAQSDTP